MKTRKFFAIALTAGLFLGAGACGGNADGQSVAEKTSYEFSFASGLPEKSEDYPGVGTGTVYYVSAKGNDNNDGLTEETPLRTIKKVNSLDLGAGDSICFKRGETFDDVFHTFSM